MRFTVLRDDLIKGVSNTAAIILSRPPIPVIGNILVRVGGDKMKLVGTDMEVTAISEIPLVESEEMEEVEFLIHGKSFQELVSVIPSDEVVFRLHREEQEKGPGYYEIARHTFRVEISGSGMGVYILPGSETINYPEIPSVDPRYSISMEGKQLKRLVGKTLFATSTDDMRAVLTGILVHLTPEELRFISTDGRRLSLITHKSLNLPAITEPIQNVVPRKAFQIFTRYIKDEDEVKLGLSESRVSLSVSGYTIISRLIEGQFPRYEQVIPKTTKYELNVKTGEFTSVLRRVSVISDSRTNMVKLGITPDKVRLEAEDYDTGGKGEEEVSCYFSGESLDLAFDHKFLTDSLKQIDTEETWIGLNGPSEAAVFKPSFQMEGEEFLMLLMPMRVK